MIGRSLLAIRPIAGRMFVRGKAVRNWKRPSMDEYMAPTELYSHANAKRQSRYNMMLVTGTAFLGFTIAFGTVMDLIEMRGTPYDIMKKMK